MATYMLGLGKLACDHLATGKRTHIIRCTCYTPHIFAGGGDWAWANELCEDEVPVSTMLCHILGAVRKPLQEATAEELAPYTAEEFKAIWEGLFAEQDEEYKSRHSWESNPIVEVLHLAPCVACHDRFVQSVGLMGLGDGSSLPPPPMHPDLNALFPDLETRKVCMAEYSTDLAWVLKTRFVEAPEDEEEAE